MQKLQQIGQLPGNFEPPKTNAPSHDVHLGSVPTTSLQTPLVVTPAIGLVSSVTNATPKLDLASPKSLHPDAQHQVALTSPPYSKTNMPSQIEEIQKSFIRKQQNIRKDSNKKDASAARTPKQPKQQRQSSMTQESKKFFPEKFPVHPSQLLRQKWQTGGGTGGPNPGQSPTIPGASLADIPSKASATPGVIQPPEMQASAAEDSKHPFTSQPELHQLALSAMQSKSPPQQPSGLQPGEQQSASMLSPPLSQKPHHLPANTSEIPAASQQKSAFSMSTILGPKTQPDQIFPPPPGVGREAEVPKIPGLTQVEHQKEVERKKNLIKLKKKEEKEKVLLEKKKARELEKQKRMEEKAKSKLLKDQKKAEKIQEKMLIRQKAMQAKEQAKQIALNKKKKTAQMNKAAILQAAEKQKQQAPVVPPSVIPLAKPAAPVPPKIPLCEPDAQLVVPLVQPIGMTKDSLQFDGKFGAALFEGFDDVYGEKPIIEELPRLPSETTLINDVPLFASPERMEIGEDEVLGEANDPTREITQEEPENAIPYELRQVLSCNCCYGPLHDRVYYIDRGFDEVSEGVFDRNDVLLSDQLAFCSNDCVDNYQKKIDYEVDDDVALVDAVKIASMVTLDENHVFPPLPTADGDVRGDACAPGMDPSKMEPDYKKRWTRWQYPFNTEKKPNKTRLMREDLYKLMNKHDVRLKVSDDIKDKRTCMLCNLVGDGETAQMSRLLNYDVNQWVHLNCALWSIEVYEALNGGLHNVDKAYARAVSTKCAHCNKMGASINCSHTFGAQQRLHCEKVFHFSCALQAQCSFYKDKVSKYLSISMRTFCWNVCLSEDFKMFFFLEICNYRIC